MSTDKNTAQKDVVSAWTKEELDRLELSFLHKMFDCKTVAGVDATVAYAGYMSETKLDPDNYPIFLKLLQFENHWVVDALLGKADPEKLFEPVQPNRFILSSCFKMFARWSPGGIYPKSLMVLIGLIKAAYEHPQEGYRLYAPSISDVNHLGKHLDENQDQRYPLNQTLLHVLDRIASLADPGSLPVEDKAMGDVATQANNIRGKFLDATKKLREAIPLELLKKGDYKKAEISPSFAKKAGAGKTE
jgi:hypothetical protein